MLRIEGKGTILLSHFVENKGKHYLMTMRIYPVLYIPGLSVKLLSVGTFLCNTQKMQGDVNHITFYNVLLHQPLMSAYP